jgi:signal transduction histidine kinase
VNAANMCRTDDVALASVLRANEHATADGVCAVLDRIENPEPHVGASRALADDDYGPLTREAYQSPTEPGLVWSGFGIAYIDAMIGGLIRQGRPLPVLLNALCGLFDATVAGYSGGVLLLDRTRTRVRHAVGPGLPPGYNELLEGRPVNWAEGPCGGTTGPEALVTALDLTSSMQSDDRGASLAACAHSPKPCWSSLILSLTGELLGIFVVYEREGARAVPLNPALLQQFTHVASIAIERTQSEHTLRRTEALLAKALRLSSTGSFSWRVAAGEITWSDEVYRIFEWDPGVPVTLQLLCARVHPEDLPGWREVIDRMRGDGGDHEHEYRLLMPDHSVKYLHVVAHASRDQDGQLEYVGVVQDVTQRRLSDEALTKARSELAHLARVQSLGALSASIAHEVNQPLCTLVTNASTCLRYLAMDPPNVDRARETVRRTIRDGNRAADVIARLRALFRKKDATVELVDLNEAASEVLALSAAELKRSRVVVQSELADNLPPVSADRVQLQQVILNLLLNARDAMQEVDDRPRQLLIRTARDEGERVRLSVQDAGVGFAPHEATERLFEPFYTTKSSGMGIGLTISRSIIESHHGRLWATKNAGPGATFTFSVPRAEPRDRAAPTVVTAFRHLL